MEYDHDRTQKRIKELTGQGLTAKQIAGLLNQEGIKQPVNGSKWSYQAIGVYNATNCCTSLTKADGRPPGGSRIGPEEKDKIVGWIMYALVSRNECIKRLDLDAQTLYDEFARDPTFYERVKNAEHRCRDGLVESVVSHTAKDWKSAQFLLACKWQSEFAKKGGLFSNEDFLTFGLRLSDLVRKYVPEHKVEDFGKEVEAILAEMERQKKKDEA